MSDEQAKVEDTESAEYWRNAYFEQVREMDALSERIDDVSLERMLLARRVLDGERAAGVRRPAATVSFNYTTGDRCFVIDGVSYMRRNNDAGNYITLSCEGDTLKRHYDYRNGNTAGVVSHKINGILWIIRAGRNILFMTMDSPKRVSTDNTLTYSWEAE